MSKFYFYFYCPKCNYEDRVDKLPRGTVSNIRDGYGTPIHHFECPQCHNLDAEFMSYLTQPQSEETEDYFKSAIGFYQDIRGFAKHEQGS